jgi:hypothetical protein
MRTSSARRAGTRALAALGAAALGAGAFALPAAAQSFEPVDVVVDDGSPIAHEDLPALFKAGVEFGDDFDPGEHTVTATITIDAPDNTFEVREGSATGCTFNAANTVISCEQEAADTATSFQFRYGAAADAEPGYYPYTLVFAVDGETVATVEDALRILASDTGDESEYVYTATDVAFTGVEPGSSVELEPEIYQHASFSDYVAAVVVTVWGPEDVEHPGVEVIADYDNCVDSYPGVDCVVTDVENLPGTVLTFADPIMYAVDEQVPGPFMVCRCEYRAVAINDDTFEEQYGGVFWDEDSDNLFGLETADDPGAEIPSQVWGDVTIETAENQYDLTVKDVKAKGADGDRVTVTTPVGNKGPAAAFPFFDGPGSYAVIGELPAGLELYAFDSDSDTGNVGELFCLDPEDWANHLPGIDTADLDFACFFQTLGAGEAFDLEFTVDITDAKSKDVGRLEVLALGDEDYPGVFESRLTNNTADITVNGKGSGQLPATGASLGLIIGIAVLVIAAGVVMFVLTSRRRVAEEADETD